MATMLLWILVSVSGGGYSDGILTTVGQFATAADCEAARRQIPDQRSLTAKCISAKVLVPKN